MWVFQRLLTGIQDFYGTSRTWSKAEVREAEGEQEEKKLHPQLFRGQAVSWEETTMLETPQAAAKSQEDQGIWKNFLDFCGQQE